MSGFFGVLSLETGGRRGQRQVGNLGLGAPVLSPSRKELGVLTKALNLVDGIRPEGAPRLCAAIYRVRSVGCRPRPANARVEVVRDSYVCGRIAGAQRFSLRRPAGPS